MRDGNGIMFVNHDGSVFPSGVLPVAVGNVRTDDLVTVRFDRATRAIKEPQLIRRAVTNVQRIDSRKLFGSPEGETGMAPTAFITLDASVAKRHDVGEVLEVDLVDDAGARRHDAEVP